MGYVREYSVLGTVYAFSHRFLVDLELGVRMSLQAIIFTEIFMALKEIYEKMGNFEIITKMTLVVEIYLFLIG